MLQPWYRLKNPATEDDDEAYEVDVVDEADEADVVDEAEGADVTDEVVEAEVVDEADTAAKSLNSWWS